MYSRFNWQFALVFLVAYVLSALFAINLISLQVKESKFIDDVRPWPEQTSLIEKLMVGTFKYNPASSGLYTIASLIGIAGLLTGGFYYPHRKSQKEIEQTGKSTIKQIKTKKTVPAKKVK